MTPLTTDIIDKDRGFRMFSRNELYSLANRTGYVPNNNDLVKDDVERVLWEVVDVDYTALTWRLIPWNPVQIHNETSIFGGLAPLKGDEFCVYVDTTKHPATLRFDDRLDITSADIDSVRLFRGTNTSEAGEILSGYFKDGRLQDTKIPVRAVTGPGAETVIKKPLPGVCLSEVKNGELCRAVLYADNGDVASIFNVQIAKTNVVMAAETPYRQVLDVKLLSPFLSDTNSKLLQLPINMPIDDIPLSVEVHYNTGKKTYPIDGNRVSLIGLRNAGAHDTYYIASNAGNQLPLSLTYRLGADEAYNGDDIYQGTIVKDYLATTETVDGAYSLKLFVVPVWLDATRGYRLRYYLYNLMRGNWFDATPHVEMLTDATPFDPLLYGVKQRLNVQVDVSKVAPFYKKHIHSQSFHLTLAKGGNTADTNFLLDYIHDGNTYGLGVFAKFNFVNVSYATLDIKCGLSNKSEWLDKLYYPTYPLYDRRNEATAPTPTHFELVAGDQTIMFPIDAWMEPLEVHYQLKTGSEVIIRWIRRTPTDTFYLGQSSMLAHQV